MSTSYGFSLQPTDTSADFANALYNIVGDGVAQHGGQFALTVNGYRLTVASGYGFAGGRWIENDEPLTLNVQAAWNNEDRTDAIVARVDYGSRMVSLEVMADVDVDAIRENPALVRNETEYCVILFLIRVRRGATSLSLADIIDFRADSELCGTVLPLSAVAGDVFRVYRFLTAGIDAAVDRVAELSEAALIEADEKLAALNEEIKAVDGAPQIGELLYTCVTPNPQNEWLLCDGGVVPSEYSELRGMIGLLLPNIPGEKHRTYIYAGTPGEPKKESSVVGEAVVGTAIVGRSDSNGIHTD